MKMFDSNINAITTICVYGYSFTVLCPILVLCVLPYEVKLFFRE